MAVNAMDTERAAATEKPTEAMTAGVWVDLVDTVPVEYGPWEFVDLYRTAEDPLEVERMEDTLLAHGYFSVAVPLPFEYQDYMRTYCHLYGDTTKAAMAYSMGQAGAASAWEAGITSTRYTDAVLAALEMCECTVNAWAGE